MHVKRTAAIVLGGGALAAWLAGAATSNRTPSEPILFKPAPVDARGSDLAKEIEKLHERLRPSESPHAPGRNLFAFHAAAAPVAGRPPASNAALTETPVERNGIAPAQIAMKLSGISEDPGADPAAAPIRMAFISGDGQLFIVKEGEQVTPRYRVEKIAVDAVELTDLTDNSVRRLTLR
jgi:hypothetical protein